MLSIFIYFFFHFSRLLTSPLHTWIFFSFFLLFLFPSCTLSCNVMTSRCRSMWSSCLASWEERWRETRETQSWMTIMNPAVMRRRTMQMQPWSTDHSPMLALWDFTLYHHASDELKCSGSLKGFFFFFLLVILSHPFINDGIWLQLRGTERMALKAAVYSISFSQLFNVFGEISAYLSNASRNVLDRCWWKKLDLELYFSPATKAKRLRMPLPPYTHPHNGFYKRTHTSRGFTHTNKNHSHHFSSFSIEVQQHSPSLTAVKWNISACTNY